MTPGQRKELRARAHALKPVIMVGDAGLSEAVLAETERALNDHELIKVRLPGVEREIREQMAQQLCSKLNAEQIHAIGHVRVIFRANPPQEEKPAAKKTKKPAPKRVKTPANTSSKAHPKR